VHSEPLTLPELARRLGHAPTWLYRKGRLARLHAEGLPLPISNHGQARFDRASVEAWLGRHHPNAPPLVPAANDTTAAATPRDDAAWRRQLQDAYTR
jgi:predicted DNA-binding transcriptional regulator AlpA